MEILDIIPYDTKDRLKELLNEKKMTQEKLAHDLDVSVITISKWFNGGDIRLSKNILRYLHQTN